MKALLKHMGITAGLLGLFAVLGTALVAVTFDVTEEPIAESKRKALLKSLHELVPPNMHDNDIFNDVILTQDTVAMGTDQPVKVYLARKGKDNVAAVFSPVAPDGYSGNIYLLVAVDYSGTLLGVRVVDHKETPGLGDAIDKERSDWMDQFDGKSLANPAEDKWKVRKDGGEFDQLTGATITPRAVVAAVKRVLKYYRQHRDIVFAEERKIP